MTINSFFEQLALQLGVGRVLIKEKKKRKRGQVISTNKRYVAPRHELSPSEWALWYLVVGVRNLANNQFGSGEQLPLGPEHIAFIRRAAEHLNFESERHDLEDARRDKYSADEAAWNDWEKTFEEVVKDLQLESTPTE